MRWRDLRRSENVEDRRGKGGLVAGGGVGALVLALVVWLAGGDPTALLQTGGSTSQVSSAEEEKLKDFVSVVLADTEDTWRELFRRMNREYRDPKLVLFSGSVQSACGIAGAASGPFYCPRDQKLYLDLTFFRELRDRFRAPGDFAQAYVIAHEVGHHVQTLLGISGQVMAERERAGRTQGNALSVRQELQADCLAGVWAHHAQQTRKILEPGDIEEALGAATAIGDDRLQRQTQGRVVPESFTHGTSAQRSRWFRQGFSAGDVGACDTFSATQL